MHLTKMAKRIIIIFTWLPLYIDMGAMGYTLGCLYITLSGSNVILDTMVEEYMNITGL